MSSSIYKAPRGDRFKNFIKSFVMMGNANNKKIIDIIMNTSESDTIFSQAFTSKTADEFYNYEVLEQLGDVTVNEFLVVYSYIRFPQVVCPAGVKIVARHRINLGSKTTLSSLAEKYGFWTYISSSREQRTEISQRIDLLEDTFEAIFGAIKFLCLKYTKHPGIGYEVCYNILQEIFDTVNISLKTEELIDSKTRLKELYDQFPEETLEYDFTKNLGGGVGVVTISSVPKINTDIIKVPRESASKLKQLALSQGIPIIDKTINLENANFLIGGKRFKRTILGKGTGTDKKSAEADAAKQTLRRLEDEGKYLPKPEDPYKCLEPQFSFF